LLGERTNRYAECPGKEHAAERCMVNFPRKKQGRKIEEGGRRVEKSGHPKRQMQEEKSEGKEKGGRRHKKKETKKTGRGRVCALC